MLCNSPFPTLETFAQRTVQVPFLPTWIHSARIYFAKAKHFTVLHFNERTKFFGVLSPSIARTKLLPTPKCSFAFHDLPWSAINRLMQLQLSFRALFRFAFKRPSQRNCQRIRTCLFVNSRIRKIQWPDNLINKCPASPSCLRGGTPSKDPGFPEITNSTPSKDQHSGDSKSELIVQERQRRTPIRRSTTAATRITSVPENFWPKSKQLHASTTVNK